MATGRRYSRRVRLIALGFFLLLTVVTLESASRVYWFCAADARAAITGDISTRFYPEMFPPPTTSEENLDVLILGASTVSNDFGTIGPLLEKSLGTSERPARVHNLARYGQTSRDSLWKYGRLDACQFDLVVVYDGFNEVRMNNCPRSLFRDDYSHCDWYRRIELMSEHPERPWSLLPFTLRYAVIRAATELNCGMYIPRHRVDANWLTFGNEIKSARPFSQNLAQLIELANRRQEPVIMMTFAYHLPADYSEEAFAAKSLDYGKHKLPVSIWGLPENVRKGIDSHNEAIRSVAENGRVTFVDQAALIPKDGEHFDDICHLTEKGCQHFVDNIMEALEARRALLQATPAPATRR